MMPCALIINTLADVLAELFFEVVCIFLYDYLDFIQFMLGNACILSKFNLRLQPVLGFLAVAEHMNVHPLLLVGVYLERIFAFASKYWTHNLVAFGCKYTKSFINNGHFKRKYAK